MFHVPGNYRDLSEKLSSVLEDVGVSERLVLKRRRAALLTENMRTIAASMSDDKWSVHCFGSQSEGTTTLGLVSDSDILFCNNDVNVIVDLADWKAGALNFMMIQDENVSPGYCMLQKLFSDVPEPVTVVEDEHCVKLREDVVVQKNSSIDKACPSGDIKNGPSFTASGLGYVDSDQVFALPCRTMPGVVNNWIQTQTTNGKISPDMKRYIESKPCYIVAIGNKGSSHECVEWRISSSHAERCLMLNLNITQKRCYVLMKMMLKSLLKHPDEKGLSSFMCKNILLMCIEKASPESWSASNLLMMLTLCLFELQKSIILKHCPHFIERRNNLMGRKFSHYVHVWLRKQVKDILHSNSGALLKITTDDVGRRLQFKLNLVNTMNLNAATPDEISSDISGQAMRHLAITVSYSHRNILYASSNDWTSIFRVLPRLGYLESNISLLACRLLKPYLLSNFGCSLASINIQEHKVVSSNALDLVREGIHSDIASGRLKLASLMYSVRDFDGAYGILRNIEETYDTGLVDAVCGCYNTPWCHHSERFDVYADNHSELFISNIIDCCVRFLPSEINCLPRELQYELFRSFWHDTYNKEDKKWMYLAVVDCLPYLYFLQYKTYGHLQRFGDQQRALKNLITIINDRYQNFGHRETAWNLAGQCMEQEDRSMDAFQCYVNSLKIRQRNNAANLHMCILLYRVYCRQNAKS